MSRSAGPAGFHEDRWLPPPGSAGQRRIGRFAARHGLAGVPELTARAAAEPDWFYPAAFADLDLGWLRQFHTVREPGVQAHQDRWFVGGSTNAAWLAVDRRSGSAATAVIYEGEDGGQARLSYAELADRVSRTAAGLRRLGIGRGDVVALYLPLVPDAVVYLLAVARCGGIAAPAFSGYGRQPLAERLAASDARLLVCADGYHRRGRTVQMLDTALAAVTGLARPPQLVVTRQLDRPLPAGVQDAAELAAGEPDGPAVAVDPDTPFLLAFTSGSTGRPKGAVHTHGGSPYTDAVLFGYHFDLGPGDRLCWVTDLGWIMGPVTIAATLGLGATLLLYDGAADHPRPDRLWQLVARHQLTHLGLSPTLARALAGAGAEWVTRYQLDSLRILGATGEPWTRPGWRWLHRHVGRGRVPIINLSGGTESGGILADNPAQPIRECRFAGPVLGMPAEVVDDAGRPVRDRPGELVLTRGWPGMTHGLWRDPDGFLARYWSRWPGLWRHGDRAVRHHDGSWEILGRSDDVIKVAGKRVGPTEYETLACEVPGVSAAAAVGVPHPVKGEVAVVAVTAERPAAQLAGRVAAHLAEQLGSALAPATVVVLEVLPLTRSGKVHRRALRGWLAGLDPGDLSTLENPEVADAVRAARPSWPDPSLTH